MKNFDVVVVGAGMVGAACAVKLIQQGLSVALIDQVDLKTYDNNLPNTRVSNFNEGSHQLLVKMGIWNKLPIERITPILAMRVFSEQQNLNFDAAEFGFADLGHIIENDVLTSVLRDEAKHNGVSVFCPYKLGSIAREQSRWELHLVGVEPQVIHADFLIVAQGGQSQLREHLGVQSNIEFYNQKAIVMNLEASLPHRFTAFQRFLPTGTLAFLPMFKPNWYSIVWALPIALANEYLKLPIEDFLQKLMDAFPEIGKLKAITQPAGFELSALNAQNYVGSGFALVGDTAHTVHPLAGLGVNLGLRDVKELTEIIAAHGNIFSERALAQYERRCQLHNKIFSRGFGVLNRIFQIKQPLAPRILDFGFKRINHLHGVKRQLLNMARG